MEQRSRQLYLEYHSLFKRAYPNLSKGKCQEEANSNWKSFQKGKQLDHELYNKGVSRLREKLTVKKRSMTDFLLKKPKKSLNGTGSSSENRDESSSQMSAALDEVIVDNVNTAETESIAVEDADASLQSVDVVTAKRDTPAQNKLKEEIHVINARLASLNEARQLGLGEENVAHLNKQITDLSKKKKKLKKSLKRCESDQKASKKRRDKAKKVMEQAIRDYPGLEKSIKVRCTAGRPPLEEIYPSLHTDILSIATIGAACSDRRREDLFRSVKTTDQLQSALDEMGYKLSRTALYYRLLPKDSRSPDGKRHVRTVPVRLVRPENNLRKKHPDRMFAAESYNSCYKIAETMGPEASVATSFDDKSSVHIGVTAAKRQGAMLMNLQYRVRLPDHDFNVGVRHLLCPSVVAVHRVQDGKIGYSGETYVAVRSQKHNNSTAYSHHEDLLRVIELFPEAFKTESGRVKPVIIKGTDGGPDENPRFEKNLFMGAKTFKEHDLDLYVEVTNAPGLSAFNKVERKMYHLSKELTGVVLQHDTYGSHLDSGGKTIDEDLEKKNFEAAGKTLCSIWSNLIVDGFPTVSEYVEEKPADEIKKYVPTAAFRSKHLFETQYMTVYLKCRDEECCSPFITNIEAYFPHRSIPALIPITRSVAGVTAMERSADYSGKKIEFLPLAERIIFNDSLISSDDKQKFGAVIPYDLYFPTVQEKIEKRICVKCYKYHASVKSLNVHKKVCCSGRKKRAVAIEVSSESEDEDRDVNSNEVSHEEEPDFDEHAQQADLVSERPQFCVAFSGVEQILDLKEWLKNPWIEEIDDHS